MGRGVGADEGLDVLGRGYGISDSFLSLYALKATACSALFSLFIRETSICCLLISNMTAGRDHKPTPRYSKTLHTVLSDVHIPQYPQILNLFPNHAPIPTPQTTPPLKPHPPAHLTQHTPSQNPPQQSPQHTPSTTPIPKSPTP